MYMCVVVVGQTHKETQRETTQHFHPQQNSPQRSHNWGQGPQLPSNTPSQWHLLLSSQDCLCDTGFLF